MSVGELAKGERQLAQRARVGSLAVPVRLRRRRRRSDAGDARVGAAPAGSRRCAARRDATPSRRSGTRCAPRRTTCRCGSASCTSSTTAARTRRTDRSSARTGSNEQALRAAELWSVAAAARPTTGADYPAGALDEAWKLLLLNQFHDIIPGSSIHWVNEECLRDHARVAETTRRADRDRTAGDRRAGRHHRT